MVVEAAASVAATSSSGAIRDTSMILEEEAEEDSPEVASVAEVLAVVELAATGKYSNKCSPSPCRGQYARRTTRQVYNANV